MAIVHVIQGKSLTNESCKIYLNESLYTDYMLIVAKKLILDMVTKSLTRTDSSQRCKGNYDLKMIIIALTSMPNWFFSYEDGDSQKNALLSEKENE